MDGYTRVWAHVVARPKAGKRRVVVAAVRLRGAITCQLVTCRTETLSRPRRRHCAPTRRAARPRRRGIGSARPRGGTGPRMDGDGVGRHGRRGPQLKPKPKEAQACSVGWRRGEGKRKAGAGAEAAVPIRPCFPLAEVVVKNEATSRVQGAVGGLPALEPSAAQVLASGHVAAKATPRDKRRCSRRGRGLEPSRAGSHGPDDDTTPTSERRPWCWPPAGAPACYLSLHRRARPPHRHRPRPLTICTPPPLPTKPTEAPPRACVVDAAVGWPACILSS